MSGWIEELVELLAKPAPEPEKPVLPAEPVAMPRLWHAGDPPLTIAEGHKIHGPYWLYLAPAEMRMLGLPCPPLRKLKQIAAAAAIARGDYSAWTTW